MDNATAEWLSSEMSEIKRRVDAVPKLSLNKLLKRAEVSYSTWWRWELYTQGDPKGQVARMDRVARIKGVLAEFEAESEQ